MRTKYLSFFLCVKFFCLFSLFSVPIYSLANDNLIARVESLKEIQKSKFKGSQKQLPELYLIDFWASWCEPCKEALPFYSQLQEQYKGRLKVIAVSADDEFSTAQDFALKNPVNLDLVWDENKRITKSLSIAAIPTVLVVTKEGKILEQLLGFTVKKKDKLEKIIKKNLKD